MLFCQSAKKKSHPWLTLSLMTLATVGAVGLFNSSKSMLRRSVQKIKGLFSCCPCKETGAENCSDS